MGDENHVGEIREALPVRLAPYDYVCVGHKAPFHDIVELGTGCYVDRDSVLRPFDDVAHVVDAPKAQTAIGNLCGGDLRKHPLAGSRAVFADDFLERLPVLRARILEIVVVEMERIVNDPEPVFAVFVVEVATLACLKELSPALDRGTHPLRRARRVIYGLRELRLADAVRIGDEVGLELGGRLRLPVEGGREDDDSRQCRNAQHIGERSRHRNFRGHISLIIPKTRHPVRRLRHSGACPHSLHPVV